MVDAPLSDLDSAPDSDLARAAQNGDRKALEALLMRHAPWIYRLAIRMLWNRHDAEDATQEILVRTTLKLETFEGRSSLRTWLYRLAVNQLLSVRKSAAEARAVARCSR